MGKSKKPTPNTHLGEVDWYSDMFWGNLLWLCQEMLGLGDPINKDADFLNTEKHRVSELQDFFDEIELQNGKLGLELSADSMYRTTTLCMIETTIPYGEEVGDETFLNLIKDFKEYVLSLPLAKACEGALITDPNVPGYYDESNQAWLKSALALNEALGAGMQAAVEKLRSEGINVIATSPSDDDIPF